MLQQILQDMYIDPELLAELSDEQKQILFIKMRQEQIRRCKVWEEEEQKQPHKPKLAKKGNQKQVKFYCNEHDEPIVTLIPELDGIDGDARRKLEEVQALKRAEEQARKEAEERRKKEHEAREARRLAEETRVKEEQERIAREKALYEAELRRKEEEAALYQSIKEARLQAEKAEAERKERERKAREEEEERLKRAMEAKEREEAEARKREEELLRIEEQRKAELYERIRKEQEDARQKEEEEQKRLLEEWQEREKNAKVAEQQRRSSFSYAKDEVRRSLIIAKERAALHVLNNDDSLKETSDVVADEEKANDLADEQQFSLAVSAPIGKFIDPLLPKGTLSQKSLRKTMHIGDKPSSSNSKVKEQSERSAFPVRPPLPARPTISTPVAVSSSIANQIETVPVKREVVKPTRPPPLPGQVPSVVALFESVAAPSEKLLLPPRPKSKKEVAKWWRDFEYDKKAGLDEDFKPLEWFHGIISRTEAEELLQGQRKGTFLVRVSERVWGYTVSFKDMERCKHFLIDTSPSGYQFFGTQQVVHETLNSLVQFHMVKPISALGQEVLRYPCGQSKNPPDYEHLLVESTTI